MRKILLALIPLSLSAESLWDYHPIHVGGNAIAVGPADVTVRSESVSQGSLTYNKENVYIYALLPINRTSYFFPRVEWNTFSLSWDQNPKFQETRFNYIQFALTFLSTGLDHWRWIARADYNMDTKHFTERKYALFSALLWGTHEIHRKWHFHIGALGYTGFAGQEVYPLIGVDFAPNKKWFFQLVFPVTYSIEYALTSEWRFALKARPLKERFRTDAHQPQPESVFSYSTTGVECNIHYEKFLRLEVELFGGYSFGGAFYIKDQRGNNPLYTDTSGSLYGGASLNWGI